MSLEMLHLSPSAKDAELDLAPPVYEGMNIDNGLLSSILTSSHEDSTPMFSDLDLMIDGKHVNNEDWINLFDKNEADGVTTTASHDLFDDDIFINQDIVPEADLLDEEVLTRVVQPPTQLFTPNPSSTLPTPLINTSKAYDGPTKKRKRDSTATPIKVESSDPVAFKRARNTEAARRSRARKLEKMTLLEDRVNELIQEKDAMSQEMDRMKSLLKKHNIEF